MSNTFFGFDTTLDNDGNCLVDDGDLPLDEEDEYDALNDETFGGLGDGGGLDDWEQQHEQFAELTETKRQSEQIESTLSQLVLDDNEDIPTPKEFNADWSYKAPTHNKNGDIFSSELLASLQKTVSTTNYGDNINLNKLISPPVRHVPNIIPQNTIDNQAGQKICTVEELERQLRQQKQQQQLGLSRQIVNQIPPNAQFLQMFQQQQQALHNARLPPGIPNPVQMPPQQNMRSMPPGIHPPNIPPGYGQRMHMPHIDPRQPHFNNMPPFPGQNQMQMNQLLQMQLAQQQMRMMSEQQQHLQQQQQQHLQNKIKEKPRDEYAGLMSQREKQWLLNIQQLQLNTGTPYFDDYYYTVFKDRKAKKILQPNLDKNQRFNHHHHNRNQNRQENTLTPKAYTPLQFENSLGKLQCGSVTAPRKIIDMDLVKKESESDTTPNKDTRKTKQLLLELEGLYSLMLKAEDLKNPTAIANMQKLIDLKQKQRLRELDGATTAEQKQEILKLLQEESTMPEEHPADYINKIMSSFLQEDKFCSYLNIRKGKNLLLRILPQLTPDSYSGSVSDVWMRIFQCLPLIGRRDSMGDNLLPRFHPYFKRYIQSSKVSDIIEIVTSLLDIPSRPKSPRSTPLSHQGRMPLYFVVTNRFGVSALVTIFVRMEYLVSAEKISPDHMESWTSFICMWSELSDNKSTAIPIERIPRQIFNKHTNRLSKLTDAQKDVLNTAYVDVN